MIVHRYNGEYYGFSFRRFKEWKKDFKKKFKEVYGISFNEYVPDPRKRAYIYKRMLHLSSINIFGDWKISIKVEIEKVEKCYNLAKILWY